jgi:hypothetical protein
VILSHNKRRYTKYRRVNKDDKNTEPVAE